MSHHVHFARPCDRCYSDPVATSPVDTSADGGSGLDRPFIPSPSVKPIDSFGSTSRSGCPRCTNESPIAFRTARGHDEIRYRRPFSQARSRRNSGPPLPDYAMNIIGLLRSQFNVHFVPALLCLDRGTQQSLRSNSSPDEHCGRVTDTAPASSQRQASASHADAGEQETQIDQSSPGISPLPSKRAKLIKRLAKGLSTFASVVAGQKLEVHVLTASEQARKETRYASTGAAKAWYGPDVCETPRRMLSPRNSTSNVERRRSAEASSQRHSRTAGASSITVVDQQEHSVTDEATEAAPQVAQDLKEDSLASLSSDETCEKRNIYVSTSIHCTCSTACPDCEHALGSWSYSAQASTHDRQSLSLETASVHSGPSPAPTLNGSIEVAGMSHNRLSLLPPSVRESISNGTSHFNRRRSNLSTLTNAPSLSSSIPSVSDTSVETVVQ